MASRSCGINSLMVSRRSLSVNGGKEVRFKPMGVHFTVKVAGTNESDIIRRKCARIMIFEEPLPLSVQVDIKFSCAQVLILTNRPGQILGQINLGQFISDSVCIKPSEILNSREILSRFFCDWVLDMYERDTIAAKVISVMNNFAKRMSRDSNPPKSLLLSVDATYFGVHILDEESPAYDMLEDGMEYISVLSASDLKRKRHHSPPNHDDGCIICFSEFCSEDSKLMCPCSHVFHRNCILKWLTRTPSCPICRFEVKIHLDARDRLESTSSSLFITVNN